jgi:hypothetical protein
MRKAITIAFITLSVYNLCSWKGMDLSFQGQKTEQFYLVWVEFYCTENAKKLAKILKSLRTVRHTVKNLHVFANISGIDCDILQIWIQHAKDFNLKKSTQRKTQKQGFNLTV